MMAAMATVAAVVAAAATVTVAATVAVAKNRTLRLDRECGGRNPSFATQFGKANEILT